VELLQCWKEMLIAEDAADVHGHVNRQIRSVSARWDDGIADDVSEDSQDAAAAIRPATGPCFHIMISPNSVWRSIWDMLSFMLVVFDMVMIPMSFVFEEGYSTTFLECMSWVTRLFWTLDMPASLVVGFVTPQGVTDMRPTAVAVRYLKTWFALDVVVVGSDWIEIVLQSSGGFGLARVGKMGKFFRILRMLRLLRLAKVSEIMSLLQERLPSAKLVIIFDIIKLVGVMLGSSHFLGCCWFGIGASFIGKERNWVEKHDFLARPTEDRYIMSYRWALSQFSGGMDEVTPACFWEHIYSAFVFTGCFWGGTVILSILTSHMTQLYIMGNHQQQRLNVTRRYLAQNGVSKSLALRVQRNAQHTMKIQALSAHEAAVGLEELVSVPLRIELHFELHSPLLSGHPFFGKYMEECPHVVRKICHSAMSMTQYSKGDMIFHVGQTAAAMMILKSGTLRYRWIPVDHTTLGHDAQRKDEFLVSGQWVAEAALWAAHWAHKGELRAMEHSCVCDISSSQLAKIIKEFELVTEQDPADYAQEFVDEVNALHDEDLSDLPVGGQKQPEESSANHAVSMIRKMTTLKMIDPRIDSRTSDSEGLKSKSNDFD
jgi:hypothetical protein